MTTATFIRKASGFNGDAQIYKVDPMLPYGWNLESLTDHVVVSAVDTISGPETYIFPCYPDGEVKDWGEMDGSMRGTWTHAEVLEAAGCEVIA